MTDLSALPVPVRITFPSDWPLASWLTLGFSTTASIGFWYGVAWAVTKGVTMAL